jgi:hypothetical protein
MSGVSAAVATVAAAGIGAVGSAIAGSEAASATRDASNAAIQQQQQALAQQAQLSAPYRQLGQTAMGAYQNLLGIGPNGQINPQLAQQTLQNMPGYQFQQQQGQQQTLAAAGAMGLGLSGNTLEALSKYNQGLASSTYQQELQNLLAPVQLGQAAAAGQAANVGQAAGNIGNIAMSQGQNQANIAIGQMGGITGSIGNALNNYTTMNTLKGLQGGQTGFNPYLYTSGADIGNINTGLPSLGSLAGTGA